LRNGAVSDASAHFPRSAQTRSQGRRILFVWRSPLRLYGGCYYDTQSMENVLKAECMLALRMNGRTLPWVYGAPLRLRVENLLGYKMVKWIERIGFIQSEKDLGKGEGGKNEDDEYFDLLPNI
jgi:sulfoxide reductase catalytic subunit YedY